MPYLGRMIEKAGGANTDRPALTKLLAAVEAGDLDCVVVCKVDRLSRSLLDFTRR